MGLNPIHFPLCVEFEYNVNRKGAHCVRHSDWPSPLWVCGTPTVTNVRIHHTWRDVGPCRVRLARLADGAIFPLFLTDEEQFAKPMNYGSGEPFTRTEGNTSLRPWK